MQLTRRPRRSTQENGQLPERVAAERIPTQEGDTLKQQAQAELGLGERPLVAQLASLGWHVGRFNTNFASR